VKCISHIKGVVYQNLESLLRPLVRLLLACVDLVGDAIHSVVVFSLVAAVRPMVNNVLYHKSSRAAGSIQADCQQN